MASDLGSKAYLLPDWLSREKSSSGGNLSEASSNVGGAVTWAESRAAQGSLPAPLRGEGLGLGTFGSPSTRVGLPRRMGVISGIVCFSSVGGARYAPAMGGLATSGSRGGKCWFRRASD
jgi:hypothetical protein